MHLIAFLWWPLLCHVAAEEPLAQKAVIRRAKAKANEPSAAAGEHEEDESFLTNFLAELCIGAVGFSVTVSMQRYLGRKAAFVRKQRKDTSGSSMFGSQGVYTSKQAKTIDSRSPSKEKNRATESSPATEGEFDEFEGDEQSFQRAEIRKVIAALTGTSKQTNLQACVLGSIAAIEERSKTSMTPKQIEDCLVQILKCCASAKCFRQAVVAFDCLSSRIGSSHTGCVANTNLWSLVLFVATEAGCSDRCVEFYTGLQSSKAGPSARDFVNVVRAFARQQDLTGLMTALDDIKKRSHESSLRTESLIRNRALGACYREGATELALAIAYTDAFAEPLDNVGYNTLITCFSKKGFFQRSFDFFDEMEANGVKPTEATFGSLLEACCGAHDVLRAKTYLAKIRSSGLTINAVHCTTLIKALIAQKCFSEAEDVLEELSSDAKVKPDIIVFYTLMKSLVENGDIEAATRVYKSMRNHKVKPDEYVFHCLINGAASDDTVTISEFQSLFAKFLSDGLAPTTTTLSIMLKAFAKRAAWKDGLELLDNALDRFKLRVETRLYVQFAQAAIKANYRESAIEIHNAMVTAQGQRGQEGKAASRWLLRQCEAIPPSKQKNGKALTV
jgi:pentatricopeptide repeat protein